MTTQLESRLGRVGPKQPVTGKRAVAGFMPGMKALYERFAKLSWALCEPAVQWATESAFHARRISAAGR